MNFAGAIAAIDCSSNPRLRCHPIKERFYNCAKQFYYLYVHALFGLDGAIYHVHIVEGRNGDISLLLRSNLGRELRRMGMSVLENGGYSNSDIFGRSKR